MYNWEAVARLELDEGQKKFIPDNLFSLAQSKFDDAVPYGILYKGEFVGMIIHRTWNHICWITRIMIDFRWQKLGIGSEALSLFVKYLKSKVECQEIRTTISRENIWALYLFESAGFEIFSNEVDSEIVMRYKTAT